MAKRVSALDARLRELGAEMGEWNDMEVPFTFPTDPQDERDAVRNGVGMWDTSALKKLHVRGPDALAAVDHLATRDMSKIYVGKSAYTPVLLDNGHFCDDAYVYNLAENHYLVVHGGGEGAERVHESAVGKDADVELDEDLHMLSVQGPKSADLLGADTTDSLAELAFCHQMSTRLYGVDVRISRTGFSGGRGYEVMVNAANAVDVYNRILENGKPMGMVPISFGGIDVLHVESALLFYGGDATPEHTPWECACAWAVSRKKGDFRGRKALFELEGKEKVLTCGIEAQHDGALDIGADIVVGGQKVGTVNSPVFSRALGKSIAMCHIAPAHAAVGSAVEVKGESVVCSASVVPIPFVDPKKERLHAM